MEQTSEIQVAKLQWGRGLKTPEIRFAPRCRRTGLRFNGAGVLRPRKCGAARLLPVRIACFNGAGVLRPRK